MCSISVVMAGYNEESNVARAIEETISMLAENFSDYELILINDDSKDKTSSIIQEYAEKNSHIIYLENYINLNFGTSILRGLYSASKQYVIFNAMDLPLEPRKIPEMISRMDEEKIDVCVLERVGYNPKSWRKITSKGNNLIQNILFPKLMKGTPVLNYIQIFNRDILSEIRPLARSPIFVWPELIFRSKINKNINVVNVQTKCQVINERKGSFGKPHDIIWGLYDMIRFRILLWRKKI